MTSNSPGGSRAIRNSLCSLSSDDAFEVQPVDLQDLEEPAALQMTPLGAGATAAVAVQPTDDADAGATSQPEEVMPAATAHQRRESRLSTSDANFVFSHEDGRRLSLATLHDDQDDAAGVQLEGSSPAASRLPGAVEEEEQTDYSPIASEDPPEDPVQPAQPPPRRPSDRFRPAVEVPEVNGVHVAGPGRAAQEVRTVSGKSVSRAEAKGWGMRGRPS